MAYSFRGANQPNAGEPDDSRSPPHNASNNSSNPNDSRTGLTRRFTMNALPTLSPIGQQRRQAAGDMVSTQIFRSIRRCRVLAGRGHCGGGGDGIGRLVWENNRIQEVTQWNSQRRPSELLAIATGLRSAQVMYKEDARRLLPMLQAWIPEIQQETEHLSYTIIQTSMLTSQTQAVGGFGRVSSHTQLGRY